MVRHIAALCTLSIALALTGCPSDPEVPDAPVEGDVGSEDGGAGDGGARDGGASDGGARDGGGTDAPPAPACGDGTVDADEDCDDGNLDAGDGCDAGCAVEAGWDCDGASPTACDEVCGDGAVVGDEAGPDGCDDGGTAADDGCDPTCAVEMGWACMGAPSVCTPDCGDGLVSGAEGCDDGNNADGDGCSMGCQVETGYACDAEPSDCAATCGDGTVAVGAEVCDDGNTVDETACPYGIASCDSCAAGCDAVVRLSGNVCGDGAADPDNEGCDDGNTTTEVCAYGLTSCTVCSDGCASVAGVTSFCGDTLVDAASGELCDDGNAVSESACAYGFATCTGCAADCTGELSLTGNVCGDGAVDATNEGCDDGNLTAGDGCSDACRVEPNYECTGSPSVCAVLCSDGALDPGETCDDGNLTAGDGCSDACQLEITCAAGETVFRFVDPTSAAIPDNDPTGVVSTFSVATAGPVTNAVLHIARITHPYVGDLDITLTSPTGVARDVSSDNGSGGDNYVRTYFADDATTAITAGAPPYTGRFRPEQPFSGLAAVNAAGTWTARFVDDLGVDLGTLEGWSIALCIAPGGPFCGDGALGGAETCDDGNGASGDGCSNLCTTESGFVCAGTPSVCRRTVCGDGLPEGTEACDDGNTTAADGCSATCTIETGYVCAGSPSACRRTVCGDGLREGTEVCDDGNTAAADGCSATCTVESGFTCTTGSPSVCRPPYLVAPITAACVDMTSASAVSGATGDDLVSASSVFPFPFTYFASSVGSYAIGSNGNVQLFAGVTGTGSSSAANGALPTLGTPNGTVAAFWDDLIPNTGGGVRVLTTGAAPNRVFVVEWNNVRPFSGTTGGAMTFQAQFSESGTIEFHYCSIAGTGTRLFGDSATIGLENLTGSSAVQFSFNRAAAISAGSGLRFTPNP